MSTPTTGPAVPPVAVSTFQRDVLEANLPVLVDVWSPACAVCRAMEPVVAALAEAFEGRVRVVALDAEAHPEVADRYDIRALPTLLLFKGGEPIGRATGYVDGPLLRDLLEGALEAA